MNTNSTTNWMQLVDECKNGNNESKRQLGDLLSIRMLDVCVEICPSFKDAQKVLAEGLVRLFKEIPNYSGTQNFLAWCRSFFVTTAIEYIVYIAEEISSPGRKNPLRIAV